VILTGHLAYVRGLERPKNSGTVDLLYSARGFHFYLLVFRQWPETEIMSAKIMGNGVPQLERIS